MKQKFEKIKIFLIENYKWIILFICVISLIVLIEDVMDNDIMAFDEKGYFIISRYLMSDTMTSITSIILLIFLKNKKTGICIAINLGLSALVNFTIKQIIQRPRPVGHRIIDESGYSLPSGHSMVSMAFYGFLIYLIYKNVKNKYLKTVLIVLLTILIISIGVSRIYLGVHYVSDVLAGFLVAIAYLVIFIHAINNVKISGKS